MRSAVIVDTVRTASGRGKSGGALADVHPADLLGRTLEALVARASVDPGIVDDVIAGCVSQVGDQAVNIARTGALVAGFPESVPAASIDRQCGSSQQAMHFAAQGVISGAYEVAIACGVESMSRIPMGSSSLNGDPTGPLSARYPEGLVSQGISAELIAAQWNLSRSELDEYSAESHQFAAACAARGDFANEIIPIEVTGPDGPTKHVADQTIRGATTVEKLSTLPASFESEEIQARFPQIEWLITAGNSSPLTDGASAALIMSEDRARQLGLKPRARFHTFALTGSDPLLMLTGVIPATEMALKRSGLKVDDIDVFEVNEAFAPVALAWARDFGVDRGRLNPRGGAIALGHALGASGVRIMSTMLNHLEMTGGRFGLQTMCEGGGMANATIIERL